MQNTGVYYCEQKGFCVEMYKYQQYYRINQVMFCTWIKLAKNETPKLKLTISFLGIVGCMNSQ